MSDSLHDGDGATEISPDPHGTGQRDTVLHGGPSVIHDPGVGSHDQSQAPVDVHVGCEPVKQRTNAPTTKQRVTLGQCIVDDELHYTTMSAIGEVGLSLTSATKSVLLETVLQRADVTAPPALARLLKRRPEQAIEFGQVSFRAESVRAVHEKQLCPRPGAVFRKLETLVRQVWEAADEDIYAPFLTYIPFTYVFSMVDRLPYLLAIGDPETGKSTAAELYDELAFAPWLASRSTPAAVCSLFNIRSGTLILDEYKRGNREMETILRAGHRRRTGKVAACEAGLPVARHVYGPKLILAENDLDDAALVSRCIVMPTVAAKSGWRVDLGDIQDELTDLRDQLHAFGLLYASRIRRVYQSLRPTSDLSNRGWDLARPLLAVARIIDDDDPGIRIFERVLAFMKKQARTRRQGLAVDNQRTWLASLIIEFVGSDAGKKAAAKRKPGFYVARAFMDFVNAQGVLEVPFRQPKEMGIVLNRYQLILQRLRVDMSAPDPTPDALRKSLREQRQAYKFDLKKCRGIHDESVKDNNEQPSQSI